MKERNLAAMARGFQMDDEIAIGDGVRLADYQQPPTRFLFSTKMFPSPARTVHWSLNPARRGGGTSASAIWPMDTHFPSQTNSPVDSPPWVKVNSRWFQRRLYLGEQLSLTADHFKMICDEVHEMGRIREKQVSGCNCPIED